MLGEQEKATYTAPKIKQLKSKLKLRADNHRQERMSRRQLLTEKHYLAHARSFGDEVMDWLPGV